MTANKLCQRSTDPLALREQAQDLGLRGDVEQALRLLEIAKLHATTTMVLAQIANDLGALAASQGRIEEALSYLEESVRLDPDHLPAQRNRALLRQQFDSSLPPEQVRIRIALISFLFNWPSTGGGNVHTVELAHFLSRSGYEVQHFFATFAPWGIGAVSNLPKSTQLVFEPGDWNVPTIQARFQKAISDFSPDYVVITDSWSMKPLLAEAVKDYRFLLRLQAMECLCPLNNVRLLMEPEGQPRQCHRHQLAAPGECHRCLQNRSQFSGALHQAERELCRVGSKAYHQALIWAFAQAEAVLVVNPMTEAMISPFTQTTKVVSAGMSPDRFPRSLLSHSREKERKQLFFAGLVQEWMKGYAVLHEACRRMWHQRQDFELIATGEPPGEIEAFARYVGWLSQEELPEKLAEADILVMPTVAQEGLGRSAVEAMAVGIPVLASRLGGLPHTVIDGVTGLLFEPGDVDDLMAKMRILLDDEELRRSLGEAGRQRFEEHFSWPVIIERHYRPLFGSPIK